MSLWKLGRFAFSRLRYWLKFSPIPSSRSRLPRKRCISKREQLPMIRDASAVDYGGQTFFRAEYKVTLPNSQTGLTGTLYVAYVYTKFRGFFIGETIMAGSTELIDAYANLLRGISFRQDEINPECVMSSTPQFVEVPGLIPEAGTNALKTGSEHPLGVRCG